MKVGGCFLELLQLARFWLTHAERPARVLSGQNPFHHSCRLSECFANSLFLDATFDRTFKRCLATLQGKAGFDQNDSMVQVRYYRVSQRTVVGTRWKPRWGYVQTGELIPTSKGGR